MNYASTNEPREPMILLDAEGMAASVDAYTQSDEYKQKLAERQAQTPADVAKSDMEAQLKALVRSGKQLDAIVLYRKLHPGVTLEQAREAYREMYTSRPTYEELEKELATVRAELQAAREREAALWKFYDFMVSVDATNDVLDELSSDMHAASNHELLTGDSQMNRDAVQVWADYDALLTELKALKASSK